MSRPQVITFWSFIILFALYSAAVYTRGTSTEGGRVPISEQALDGKQVMRKYNCYACHQIYGMGGYIGPDLTNVMSTIGKGEIYARAILSNGTDFMPNFDLGDEEVDAVLEYLRYIDQTGHFPEKNVTFTWYGSYDIDAGTQ